MRDLLALLRQPRTRAWAYRVLSLVGAVLVGYGLITDAELALWLGALAGLLGVETAAVVTRPARHPRADKWRGHPAAAEQLRRERRRALGWRD